MDSKMVELLVDIIPEIEARIAGLRQAWPGDVILATLRKNERILERIRYVLFEEDTQQ